MYPDWLLAFLFAAIAFIYASVGFGGGSSYLALLAVAGLPYSDIRLTALLCNILVVAGSVWLYVRGGQLNFRKVFPLVVASVPLAFCGGAMRIGEAAFFKLLGVSLLAASLLLWIQPYKETENPPPKPSKPFRDGFLGGCIGYLSGMVGIGGGIFLSPLLHLFHWDTARKIAATASAFILVNSIAGIAGQLTQLTSQPDWVRTGLLGIAVVAGGQAGARLSIKLFEPLLIRRLTAVLVFIAGVEVLLRG
jgi:hypothetical protein